MTTLLIDSNVWSHLVLGDATKQEKIRADLALLLQKYPAATRALSEISVAECLVAARRLAQPGERSQYEAAFAQIFSNNQLVPIPVSTAVLNNAASLRADLLRLSALAGGPPASADGGKLKLIDAIIAASCLEFDAPAVLVTENDKDFRYLEAGITKTVAGLIVERVG